MFNPVTKTFQYGNQTVTLETGKIARQATGAVVVKINDTQVQGKSLTEAVDLMRGPVGTDIVITVRRIGEKKSFVRGCSRKT